MNLEQLSIMRAQPEVYLYADVLKPCQIYIPRESTLTAD
jgi:hypothetical protein